MSQYYGRSESKSSSGAGGGLGFTSVLQIVFIVLKLCHVIDWSWWWVLSPTWISIALVLLIFFVIVIVAKVTS